MFLTDSDEGKAILEDNVALQRCVQLTLMTASPAAPFHLWVERMSENAALRLWCWKLRIWSNATHG